MSITALITGKLIADPERRTGASGKHFTVARLTAHDGDAESVIGLVAFGSLAAQLEAMNKGDAVAITGRARLSTWTTRDGTSKTGLNVTVDRMLTAYHLRRKRQAVAAERDAPAAAPGQRHDPGEDFGPSADGWLAGGAP